MRLRQPVVLLNEVLTAFPRADDRFSVVIRKTYMLKYTRCFNSFAAPLCPKDAGAARV